MALALANERRDNSLASADTALKRAALNKARDAQIEAQRNLATAPPDTSPAELRRTPGRRACRRRRRRRRAVRPERIDLIGEARPARRGRDAVVQGAGGPHPRPEGAAERPPPGDARVAGACGLLRNPGDKDLQQAGRRRPPARRRAAPSARSRGSPARSASRCRPTRSSSSTRCRCASTPCGCGAATRCPAA